MGANITDNVDMGENVPIITMNRIVERVIEKKKFQAKKVAAVKKVIQVVHA
jgi:hypothetical protein